MYEDISNLLITFMKSGVSADQLLTATKRLHLVLLVLILSCQLTISQAIKNEKPPFSERLFYGGSFSLQLGSITNIEVSPVIGLWVLPRLGIAAGPSYQFFKMYDVRTDIIGGRSYLQLVVLRDIDKFIPIGIHTSIFFHIEDEMLSLKTDFWKTTPPPPERFLINTVLAGGGLSQQMGRRSSVNMMVLWAITDNGYEIYSNPEFRIGFVF